LQSLTHYYYQLLGLPSNWKVENVSLSITGKQIECPVCGQTGNIDNHAVEQQWRHLDTMPFETILVARLPRCQCMEHGVKIAQAP